MSTSDKALESPRIDFADQHYVQDIIDIKGDRCWDRISEEF